MVFLFDSLCAAILFVAAILSLGMAQSTRPSARVHLRFAAMMLAAFSTARILPNLDLALDAALLLPSLAAAAAILALSLPRRASIWFSCLILIAGLVAGLMAALRMMPVVALGYQAGAAAVLCAWGLSRFEENPHMALLANLGAASLLFGAMAVMNASLDPAMLFFATFLLLVTRASQTAVADRRRHGFLFVGGERA